MDSVEIAVLRKAYNAQAGRCFSCSSPFPFQPSTENTELEVRFCKDCLKNFLEKVGEVYSQACLLDACTEHCTHH